MRTSSDGTNWVYSVYMLASTGTIDIHVVDIDLDARHEIYRKELERSYQRAGSNANVAPWLFANMPACKVDVRFEAKSRHSDRMSKAGNEFQATWCHPGIDHLARLSIKTAFYTMLLLVIALRNESSI